mgnify:CR=1 FL=1
MTNVLGKVVATPEKYSPDLLDPIRRSRNPSMTVFGWDIWHCYELSWCVKNRIENLVGILSIPANSPAIVESKSLKLYLNSLNEHRFESREEAVQIIQGDISSRVEAEVTLICQSPSTLLSITHDLDGINLPVYPSLETTGKAPLISVSATAEQNKFVSETLFSHGLRTLCPVTTQPDWGTLWVTYTGQRLDHSSFARYISGYRRHHGFHEECVEQIFEDVYEAVGPERLQVVAFYQRRGGLDITPWRSSEPLAKDIRRLARQ